MSRLIDADALLEKSFKYRIGGVTTKDVVMANNIKTAPTVDAEPVVRCKDCVHWGKHDDVDVPGETERLKGCEWAFWVIGDNGYCSYGERRKYES